MRHAVLLAFLSVFVSTPQAIVGASPPPLRLDHAIDQAMARNPDIAAAHGEALAARGRARQLGAWPNPEIAFAAEDIPTDGAGLSGSVRRLGVSQTFTFPGKRGAARQAGRASAMAAEWQAEAIRTELARLVTRAFHRVRIANLKYQLKQELVRVGEGIARATDARVEAGAAPEQERLRAEIVRENATLEVSRSRREFQEARQRLARLIGRDVEELGETAWGPPDSLATPAIAPDGLTGLEVHPLAREASARRESSEHARDRAARELLPDLTVDISGGRDGRYDEKFFDLRLSLPIPLFNRSAGLRSEALALVTVAEAQERETLLLLRESLANARFLVTEARDQIEAYRSNVLPRAEGALQLVRTGYEAGKFGFLELLDTQRTHFESRDAYLDRLLDYHEAVADLDALSAGRVTTR